MFLHYIFIAQHETNNKQSSIKYYNRTEKWDFLQNVAFVVTEPPSHRSWWRPAVSHHALSHAVSGEQLWCLVPKNGTLCYCEVIVDHVFRTSKQVGIESDTGPMTQSSGCIRFKMH